MPNNKKWKPEYYERYWCITDCGEVISRTYTPYYKTIEMQIRFGNCFRTRKEAVLVRKRVKEAQ